MLGTVADFYLPQSYTDISPLLKRSKEYICALPIKHSREYMVWTDTERSSKYRSQLDVGLQKLVAGSPSMHLKHA